MSNRSIRDHLRDVAFTTPVPFSEENDEILYDKIGETVSYILDAGGRTIIPCGNTGEYYSLTGEERFNVVRETVKTVGSDAIVIAGVGGSTKSAIAQIEELESIGVDGIMVHDADHTYIHQKGLVDYYRKIAKATEIEVVLYKRDAKLSLEVISELAKVDNIVGLKFAVNNIDLFSKTAREVPDDFVLSTGNAERFAPAYALEGAEGFTTGIGSFIPHLPLALQDAIESEEWSKAMQIRDLIRPYEEIREEPGPNNTLGSANNVPAVKYGLELAGLYGGPVREPLRELSAEAKQRADLYYKRMANADVVQKTHHS